LIIALDPERFLGADRAKYFASAEAMFADMQAQGARIPGERRYRQRRQSERDGVEIPRTLYDEIVALCD
ncbi:oxidoreductase, partial [Serratia marcescens]